MNPRQIDRVHILFLFVTSHVALLREKISEKGIGYQGVERKVQKKKRKGTFFPGDNLEEETNLFHFLSLERTLS